MSKPRALKRIMLRCAIDNWFSVREENRAPKRKRLAGWRVDRWFGIREANDADDFDGWAVIHLQTGFAAATGVISKEAAIECAQKMTAARGDAWNFTDANAVRGWTDARAIRAQYHGHATAPRP